MFDWWLGDTKSPTNIVFGPLRFFVWNEMPQISKETIIQNLGQVLSAAQELSFGQYDFNPNKSEALV